MHADSARAARVESALGALRAQGLDPVWVDRAPVFDKTTLLHALYQSLQLPGWFGFNWDALADALGELASESAVPRVLVFADFALLESSDSESAAIFLDILSAVAGEGGALRGMVRADEAVSPE